jgi:HEAT repeat protein
VDKTPGQISRMRHTALEAIGSIGKYREKDVLPEALSSLLENYLDTMATGDMEVFGAIARGLSTVGTERGVETLLNWVETQGGGKPEIAERLTKALRQVRSPEAVTPLLARLHKDPELHLQTTRIAGEALAAMGRSKATEALLQWAAMVSGEKQIRQALAWFSHVRDEESLQLLLHPKERFRDPQMREKIAALAVQINKQSTPQLIQEGKEKHD